MVARWRAAPAAAAQALLLEHRALALNPNMTLFSGGAALDVAAAHGLDQALAAFDALKAESGWAVYDVRRIHHPRRGDPTRRGMVWRSVTARAAGTRAHMLSELGRLASAHGAELSADRFDITRATLLEPAGCRYPQPERRLVVAPDGVLDKQRPTFTERWHRLVDQDPGGRRAAA